MAYGERMEKVNYKKSYWSMIIVTVLMGLLYGIICNPIFDILAEYIWTPLVVGLYFGGFSTILAILIFLLTKILLHTQHKGGNIWKVIGYIAIIFVCSILFEFLYELDASVTTPEATSYVFLIDNSGSMEQSDPKQKRIEAIKSSLSDREADFPYTVVSFSDEFHLVRNMASIENGIEVDQMQPEGGTSILGSLEGVHDMLTDGTLEGGDAPRVLLISDGYPTDSGFIFKNYKIKKLLRKYTESGISISTVGLGDDDEKLMRTIAEGSGGCYVDVEDASELVQAMGTAIRTNTNERNLLSLRYTRILPILYAVMRIVFLGILGIGIAFMKTEVCEKFIDTKRVLRFSIIFGILAGAIIELGINLIGISPWVMRVLMCILLAITIVTIDAYMPKPDMDNVELGL